MVDISERSFEESVEARLLAGGRDDPAAGEGLAEPTPPYGLYAAGGYSKRPPGQYDRSLCLDTEVVIDFIQATQPTSWDKLKGHYGDDVKDLFVKRLSSEIERRGVLDVLRKGIKDAGEKFDLLYYRPASTLNPDLQKLYEANMFTVVRQLRYSSKNENSIDVVLFLNGIPLFTAELKNPLNAQNVRHAITQYQQDRDPREPLLVFGQMLGHFAVDPNEAYVTTKLAGKKTRFLPFNQGYNRGAGNPPRKTGFATQYLWEHVWSKDSVLELIQRFITMVDEEDDKGKRTGKRKLIFPRYHQLHAVRELVKDALRNGVGEQYLIQHSAGSGKSNTIAWLAHQLSVLHDTEDKRVFDTIIVITDRRILDRQLQRTVRMFEQTLGLVENIDTTSRQLKDALEAGRTIVVTTLQKFPMILDQVSALKQRRFALVIDEAHSSQSGETTRMMHQVLSVPDLEEAEKLDKLAEDPEDRIIAVAVARGPLANASTFAFTATPKEKTMQLFGVKQPDGSYEPFSLYSMRQAIEEGFIMDVLQNYTTYGVYFELLKKVEKDPRLDQRRAAFLAKLFVDLHDHSIDQKVAIMVEHFHQHSAHRIAGAAKAMIVTRSRLHAVRTKLALDRHLEESGLPYKSLVAFSGGIEDGGKEYTEASMNNVPERNTATVFKQHVYRFLVVAEKFQTGFDEPKLHTMYVDKKLSGLNAVQTLSRLNRTDPDKQETMVLDFANRAEDIQEAFQRYYEASVLTSGTDPNELYRVGEELIAREVFDRSEVDAFAAIFFNPKESQDKIYGVFADPLRRFSELDADERRSFRKQLGSFTRLYAFVSQLATFVDADLESLYHFARLLARALPREQGEALNVQQLIEMESFRIVQESDGTIELEEADRA